MNRSEKRLARALFCMQNIHSAFLFRVHKLFAKAGLHFRRHSWYNLLNKDEKIQKISENFKKLKKTPKKGGQKIGSPRKAFFIEKKRRPADPSGWKKHYVTRIFLIIRPPIGEPPG